MAQPKTVRPLDPEKDFDNPVKRLPGMEDAGIPEIEDAAYKYAKIRDRRISAGNQEKQQKDLLLALLKKHNKRNYEHNGVTIEIVVESESVKVRVKDEEEESSNAVRDKTQPARQDRADERPARQVSEEPAEAENESGETEEEAGETGDEVPF